MRAPAVAAVVAAALLFFRLVDPAASGAFAPCPVRALTGWLCPGCGSLRMLHALAHGRLGEAWALNPLALLLLPCGVLLALRPEFAARVPRTAILLLAVVVLLYGAARNLLPQ